MEKLNEMQLKMLSAWRAHLRSFLFREWLPASVWTLGGALWGAVLRIAYSEQHFHDYFLHAARSHGITARFAWSYRGQLTVVGICFILFLVGVAAPTFQRFCRSWISGCTSGLPSWCFVCSLALMLLPRGITVYTVIPFVSSSIFFWAISFALYLRSQLAAFRSISESDLRVRDEHRSVRGGWNGGPDEAIQSWEEDVLGRAAVVDILTSKALIGKAGVIALSGPLGVGKSSVLNLLQKHLEDKAVVVRFVTWLPGSQDVLSSYLFSDVATECQKRYVVPGLRRSTRRIARALAETVPSFKGALEFLPESTQRDDMIALSKALSRLPQRVIVLLDELDRMEKDELLTLLKMLRGISNLPNCTFICALDMDELMETVRVNVDEASQRYFEKFFPTTVPLPRLDEATLQRAGVLRVLQAFERQEWFGTTQEKEKFESELAETWREMIAPLCSTLRGIGLFATDIDIAASLLRRQVDPLDLILIEVLRRFRPALYALVARNKLTLTGGQSWVRGGTYISDERKKKEEELLKKDVEAVIEAKDEASAKAILKHLFPAYEKMEGRAWHAAGRGSDDRDVRISDPEMFSAYFQYELPEGMFSTLELEQFLEAFRTADDDDGRSQVYEQALQLLPKTSLRRDDFLRKLSVAIKDMTETEARNLAVTSTREAKEYTYDMFAGFGEAGHVIRIIIRAAEKMGHEERVTFLRECIQVANDDTLALRVLVTLTNSKSDVRLEVEHRELRPAFVERMRGQYGEHSNADMDLSTSDAEAFHQWGWIHPDEPQQSEDRRIQESFWVRRIGRSRRKLAEAFSTFLMPRRFAYPNDPAPFVEMCISLAELGRLFNELPEEIDLTVEDANALERIRGLLAGEFKGGIPITHD